MAQAAELPGRIAAVSWRRSVDLKQLLLADGGLCNEHGLAHLNGGLLVQLVSRLVRQADLGLKQIPVVLDRERGRDHVERRECDLKEHNESGSRFAPHEDYGAMLTRGPGRGGGGGAAAGERETP